MVLAMKEQELCLVKVINNDKIVSTTLAMVKKSGIYVRKIALSSRKKYSLDFICRAILFVFSSF